MSLERGRHLERRDALHRLAVAHAVAPGADVEDAGAGHGFTFHEMLHGVEALVPRMAQARFRKPLEIDVAPEEARHLRNDARRLFRREQQFRSWYAWEALGQRAFKQL